MADMEHMETLCDLYKNILDATKAHVSEGLDHVDTNELMDAVDMIKDLAEAKKDCYKACYYKTVIEAMKESTEESTRYGFRDRVRPTYDESYFPDSLTDDEVAKRWKMGYHDEIATVKHPRYGIAYEEYVDARKHYTETKSASDKEEMDRHIREHVSDTLSTMMDMYHSADADLRKRIKADITKLAADMT